MTTSPESKRKSVQELADARLAPEYRQAVKTLEAAMAAIGWPFVDRPICCGEPVEISGFIGSCYKAVCHKCDRFIFDVTGPEFDKGCVTVPDGDIYDMGTEVRWVSGQRGVQPADARS